MSDERVLISGKQGKDIKTYVEEDENFYVSTSYNRFKYPEPLTLSWRIIHFCTYFLGGISFLLASFAYIPIPSWTNYYFGGWVFTIGESISLLLLELYFS